MPTDIAEDMPDWDLIEREVRWLEENQDAHDQSVWTTKPVNTYDPDNEGEAEKTEVHHGVYFTCGTKGCLAGWAALHLGQKIDWVRALEDEWGTYDPPFDGPSFAAYLEAKGGVNGVYLEDQGQERLTVSDFVMEKFGLTSYQYGLITNSENTIERMHEQLHRFKMEWASWTAIYDALPKEVLDQILRDAYFPPDTPKGAKIRYMATHRYFESVGSFG